ncbi:MULTISPECIES: FxSxx-COOH system tetratricopeptide repeat protein [unclassified Saccharothrix]|uniref:FxSxx-COOH system tetratricopeptide repeat protein n=1 Tax=unclassified Saccharothrix TaxID=2593673 RepID=UPI00307F121B
MDGSARRRTEGGERVSRVDQWAVAAEAGIVIQAGRDANVAFGAGASNRDVSWPVRIGVPPPIADRYQLREADRLLAEALRSGRTVVLTGVERSAGVVLSGLGGVGKSQLAARYTWSVWREPEVDVVVWVDAMSREAILSRYAEVAARLLVDNDPAIAQRPAEDVARALVAWLGVTDRRWLVVFDDLQDPADLKGLWPPHTSSGQVVVTTRRQDAVLRREDRHVIELDVFSEQEALAYLTGKLPGDTDPDELLGLARDLGRLPLALAQAAAFIADKPLLTVADYRARCNDRRTALAHVMPREGELPDEHRATVAATWSLSMERADELAPGLARPLLEVLSLLDPAGVPAALFSAPMVLHYLTVVREVDTTADEVADALAVLHRLGLITLDPTQAARTVQVHSLVQRVVRDDLTPDAWECSALAAARGLMEIWPDVESDGAFAQALRSATEALDVHADDVLWEPVPHPLFMSAAKSLRNAGLITAAMEYFTRCRDAAHAGWGPDNLATIMIRAQLADCRGVRGDLAGAIADLEQVVADLTELFGDDHDRTLSVRGGLSFWKAKAGDLTGAIAEQEELLAARIRTSGEDHPDTVLARHNLAVSHSHAGKLVEATAGFTTVVEHRMRTFGPDHPYTLGARNDLIQLKAQAGDVAGAIAGNRELLADYIRVMGVDHPITMITRNNLACVLADSGDLAGAVAEHERLLVDRNRVLGADHPDTLLTRGHLVQLKADAGDVAGAIVDCRELLADRTRVLGHRHPSTFSCRNSLALFAARTGDPAGAVTEFERLLVDQVEVLGPDHPNTLATRSNLAVTLREAGDLAGSVDEHWRLLEDCERVLGRDHPDTLRTCHNLYQVTAESGDVVLAIVFYEILLRDCLRLLGEGHPFTDTVTDTLMHWEAVLKEGNHQPAPGSFDSAIVSVSYSGGVIVRGGAEGAV